MSQLGLWAVACQVLAALLLTGYYLLALLGWGWKLGAWWTGLPQPGPSPHELWLRAHWRRVSAMTLATALLLAGCWLRLTGLGLLVTAAAEAVAGFFINRAAARMLTPRGRR